MKKILYPASVAGFCFTLVGCGAGKGGGLTVFLIILGVIALALAALRTYSHYQYLQLAKKRPNRYKKRRLDPITIGLYPVAVALFVIACLGSCGAGETVPAETTQPTQATTQPTEPTTLFQPYAAPSTDPANWGIRWDLFRGVRPLADYQREETISFGAGEDYFALPGICTFRGNNYRNSPTYGTANIVEGSLSVAWDVATGTLPGTSWSGSGWTGQPLMVQWDAATRQNMNLYPEKKAQEDLVEVIYATLDGHIYFLDLRDGSYTRDPLFLGFCFKGAGALDPRGYPLMYVGGGDIISGNRPRMFVISLIDGSVLYEYGHEEGIALRGDNNNWCAFDSSPLVDAATDTLIWPGENGILYTIRLGSHYDKDAGVVTVSPEPPIAARYRTDRSGDETYWLGYEASVSVVEGYLYVSENGGMFYCVDLNTMELVWAQDTKDDSNASPVFEQVSPTEGYIYTAPSLHWTADSQMQGSVSVYKLDAITGEIVWEKAFDVQTVKDVSGGVQSTPALGRPGTNLDGMLFCSVSRTPSLGTGILVALDTATGEVLWQLTTDYYAWSSPVAVYDINGNGYIILADTGGRLHMVDGATGTVKSTLQLNGNTEASPAVFKDMLVVGTREEKIYGIKLG